MFFHNQPTIENQTNTIIANSFQYRYTSRSCVDPKMHEFEEKHAPNCIYIMSVLLCKESCIGHGHFNLLTRV